MSVPSAQMENETQVMTKWFAYNSMKANVDKFQGAILSGGWNDRAGPRFTNGFSIAIQIRWEFSSTLISILI